MKPAQVAVGASDHYAFAELVTLGIVGREPVLLDRRRVELIDEGLPIAPYHHEALKLEIEEARELVERVRKSVAKRAEHALAQLLAAHPVRAFAAPSSPYDALPERLEDVLSSRPLTNAADGMLYREALPAIAARRGLDVRRYPRKVDPLELAAEALGVASRGVAEIVARIGRAAGKPWTKDQKLATASALWALAPRLRG